MGIHSPSDNFEQVPLHSLETPETEKEVDESTLGPFSLGLSRQIKHLKSTLKQIDDHEEQQNNKMTEDLLHKIHLY
jgi:hypothetical protein